MTHTKPKAPEWTQKWETYILIGMIAINGIVTLLDFLGVLDDIEWLAERVPVLTLLTTGAIAAYLLLERRNHLNTMQEETSQRLDELNQALTVATSTVIQSLNGVELRQFDHVHELLRYVSQRLQTAQKQIDDLSWSAAKHLGGGLQVTQAAYAEYKQSVARATEEKLYREVYMFNRSHRQDQLREYLAQNSPGYSCAYYPVAEVPLMQFMVIDQEEVIILMDASATYMAIRHDGLVKLFSDYYDAIWNQATKLKEGATIYQEAVDALQTELQLAKPLV